MRLATRPALGPAPWLVSWWARRWAGWWAVALTAALAPAVAFEVSDGGAAPVPAPVSLPAPAPQAPPEDRFPKAARAYIVAIDGEVRWQRAPDIQLPPASLTKLLSAIVLLEGGFDPEKIVTVSAQAAALEGTRLRLRKGERLLAGDALTAMLVGSSNDACLALAENAAGSIAAFVQRLNERAAELRLIGTHYENPCGLPADGHVATARDLLAMAELAMGIPEIASRVALTEARFATLEGRALSVRTTNMLLGRVPGAVGVKTGYTVRAGKCLIALARRGETSVIVVLLDAPDRWWTAAALLEEAFHVAAAR